MQVLRKLPYVTEEDCYSIATSDHNKEKNRYYNKLPSMLNMMYLSPWELHHYCMLLDNYYRICLKSTATAGSDYINASFIDVRKFNIARMDGGNM